MAWRRISDKPLSKPMQTRFTYAYMWPQSEMSWESSPGASKDEKKIVKGLFELSSITCSPTPRGSHTQWRQHTGSEIHKQNWPDPQFVNHTCALSIRSLPHTLYSSLQQLLWCHGHGSRWHWVKQQERIQRATSSPPVRTWTGHPLIMS